MLPSLVFASFLAGCHGSDDTTDSATPTEPAFVTVAEDLPAALLSVTGTAADDVWAVGADDGSGPLVLHRDDAGWTRHDVGSPGDLWWAWLAGPDAVWIAGAGGRVVRYAPSTGTSTVDTTDPAITLFGVWGSGPDDVWTVGGNVLLPSNGAQVWHWDGTAWSPVALPAEAAATTAMYKVWGTGPEDVWVCGLNGVVIRWDGATWTVVPTGSTQPLYTLHGTSATDVWAVGGAGNGVALHWDGAAFTDRTPAFVETLQGVSAGPDGVVVVGWGGRVLRGDASALVEDPRGRATFADLHAVWQDPDGGRWMVGGDLGSSDLTAGTLVYDGEAPPPTWSP